MTKVAKSPPTSELSPIFLPFAASAAAPAPDRPSERSLHLLLSLPPSYFFVFGKMRNGP